MSELAELFRQHLTGPRWEITRDIVAQQPGTLADVVKSLEEDLQLLIDQLVSRGSSTDVRITAEHLVLLLGRMLPVIDSVVADIYMMKAAEIEDDGASNVVPEHIRSMANELRLLKERLKTVDRWSGPDEMVAFILEAAVAVAALHLQCITILKDVVTARLKPQTE